MNNINKLNTKNKLFIEKFETAESSGKTMQELGINRYVYRAYKRSTEADKCCRENGVKEFTISSNSTGMIRAIMALEAYGCHLNGTAMVNRDNLRIDTKQIPAFKIEIL